MQQKSHWPFTGGYDTSGGQGGTQADPESKKAHLAEMASLRQRMRHDRLIVGGRAHTKKHGLS